MSEKCGRGAGRAPRLPGPVLVWRKWFSPLAAEVWTAAWGARFGSRMIVTEEAHRSAVRVDVYPGGRGAAERLKSRFGGRVLRLGADVWWRPQEPRAMPLRIGRKLLVVATAAQAASWARRDRGRAVVWVPAGPAFGTGQHATTRMCLRALAEAWPFRSMLDAGCGSGILAIASAKLGAEGVEAFDSDASAVREARENIRRNGVRVAVRRMDLAALGRGCFDVVAANILSGPLVSHARALRGAVRPGGRLILSGIRPNQSAEVIRAFAGCRLLARRGSEGWVCLVLGR